VLYRLARRAYRYNTYLAVSSDAILCNRPHLIGQIRGLMQTYATLRDFMKTYTQYQLALASLHH